MDFILLLKFIFIELKDAIILVLHPSKCSLGRTKVLMMCICYESISDLRRVVILFFFFLLPYLPHSLLFDLVPEEEVAQKVCVYLSKPHSFSPHSSPMLLIWLKEQCKVILYCNVIFTKNQVNQIRQFDLIQYIPFRLSVCHLIMLYCIVLVQ